MLHYKFCFSFFLFFPRPHPLPPLTLSSTFFLRKSNCLFFSIGREKKDWKRNAWKSCLHSGAFTESKWTEQRTKISLNIENPSALWLFVILATLFLFRFLATFYFFQLNSLTTGKVRRLRTLLYLHSSSSGGNIIILKMKTFNSCFV